MTLWREADPPAEAGGPEPGGSGGTALGVSRQAVSRWEQGDGPAGRAPSSCPAPGYFGVSVDWLLDDARDWEDQAQAAAPAAAETEPRAAHGDRRWYHRRQALLTGAGAAGPGGCMGILSAVFPAVVHRGPFGGGLGPVLRRPVGLPESRTAWSGSSPCGRRWRLAGLVAAGPAVHPAAGEIRETPGSLPGTPRALRRPCTALGRPPGTSSRAECGICPCWPSSWRRLSGARRGSFGGWAGNRTEARRRQERLLTLLYTAAQGVILLLTAEAGFGLAALVLHIGVYFLCVGVMTGWRPGGRKS